MTVNNLPSSFVPIQAPLPSSFVPIAESEAPHRTPLEKARAKLDVEKYPYGKLGALFTEEGRQNIKKDWEEGFKKPINDLLEKAGKGTTEHPVSWLKELPPAIAGILEGMAALPVSDREKLLQSPDRLSKYLSEKMRTGMTDEEKEHAEAIKTIEEFILPLFMRLPKGEEAASPMGRALPTQHPPGASPSPYATYPATPGAPPPSVPPGTASPVPSPTAPAQPSAGVPSVAQSTFDRLMMPQAQSKIMEAFRGLEGPPPSEPEQMYALRKQMIKEMAPAQAQPPFQAQISPVPMAGGRPLAGRVSQPTEIEKPLGTSELALHPGAAEPMKPGRAELILPKKEGEVPDFAKGVSKERFETKKEGGELPANKIKADAKAEREDVIDPAYAKADEDAHNFNSIMPEIRIANNEILQEMEAIPKRNAGEEAVYQQTKAIRELVGDEIDIEANAGKLLKQSNSMTQMANFETPYTGVKGKIKKLSSAINKGVIKRMELAKKDTTNVVAADKLYAKWADTYLGDEIEPFMKFKILDPEKNFEALVKNEGTYRAVRNALSKSDPELVAKIDRSVLESRFKSYYEKPETVGTHQYKQDIADARALVGDDPVDAVDGQLKKNKAQLERKQTLEARIKEREKVTPSEGGAALSTEEKAREARLKERVTGYTREKAKAPATRIQITPQPSAAKKQITSTTLKQLAEDIKAHKKLVPEDFDKFFTSKTNIRLFRDKMKRMNRESIFQKEADNAIDQLLRGKVHKRAKMMGSEVRDVLNENFDVMSELLGRDRVNDAISYFEKRAKTEFVSQAIINAMQKLGLHAIGGGVAGKILASTTEKLLTKSLEIAE
jgi:hypothetical protein